RNGHYRILSYAHGGTMTIDRRANMLAAAAFASSMVMCIAGALAQTPSEVEALRIKAERLFNQGKYAEALATQRTVTTASEKSETAEAGAPARRTADALVSVAWYALFARAPEEALKASERAHILTPDSLPAETNRAHALLLLGRTREAVDLYLLHKG